MGRWRWQEDFVFTALLDTSVLWPSTQRDFLLSLAVEGLYRPVWSSAILDELRHHETIKLQERGVPREEAEARAARLIQHMGAFTDAEVSGWEPLEGTFDLPDPDDEHVAAAAVLADAGAIVTSNLKDFPSERLPDSLQVLPPHEFALNTVSLEPSGAAAAVQAMAGRTGRFGLGRSPGDVLDVLEQRYDMAATVALLRPLI
jgi:predicted nucleic acid-binding protein